MISNIMNHSSRKFNHPWQVTPKEAKEIQQQLASHIVLHDDFQEINFIAGVDAGFVGEQTRAAVAVLSFPQLELIEYQIEFAPTFFPYIPGYLSFREVPAIMQALDKLQQQVDMIICDGQGIAHPRRFGVACHLGLLRNIPAIGVGKTRLLGTHEPVGHKKGAYSLLYDKEECVGAVVRSRTNVNPIYVSSGHRVSLQTAIALVLQCCPKYRLPETTRWADRLASNRGRIL